MTDTDLGAQLTPDETSYFESGGATEIPADGEGDEGAIAAAPSEADEAGPIQSETRTEKMVSLAALHEERSRRKEIDRQNRDLQQQLAEMRGKFAVIDRLTAQPEPPQPTVENDIFGVVRNTSSAVQNLQRRLDAAERERHEDAARNDLVRAYQIDAAQFEAKTPDFKAAYNHLLASRAQELLALGYDSPQAIHDALLADEFAVAQMALTSRRSPAEIIYGLAQQRGYRRAGGRGAERLNTLERGRESHKSLSSTGGASGDIEMTAEALLKMPMDEFEAWCSKNPARAKRIMGG